MSARKSDLQHRRLHSIGIKESKCKQWLVTFAGGIVQCLHELSVRVGDRLGHVMLVLSDLVDFLHAARLARMCTAVEQVGQLLGLRSSG